MRDNDELSLWLEDNYEVERTSPIQNFISIKDMFSHYRSSSFFTELTKAEKRRSTESAFVESIERNLSYKHLLKQARKVTIQNADGSSKQNSRAGLIHLKRKRDDEEDVFF